MLPAMSPSLKSFSASLCCAQWFLCPKAFAIVLNLLAVSGKKSEVGGCKQFSEGQICQASGRQANAGSTTYRHDTFFSLHSTLRVFPFALRSLLLATQSFEFGCHFDHQSETKTVNRSVRPNVRLCTMGI
jgi:hypothetical protein